MIFKVQRIKNESQIRLLNEADIFSVSVHKSGFQGIDSNSVDLSSLGALTKEVGANKVSVNFPKYSGFSNEEINKIISDYDIKYIDAIAPDVHKKADLEEFLKRMKEIKAEKFISGFYLGKDDTSLLDEKDFFERMLDVGANSFQVEIESFFSNETKISKRYVDLFCVFAEQFPVLINDNFTEKTKGNLPGVKGVFISMESTKPDIYTGINVEQYARDVLATRFHSIRVAKNFLRAVKS